MVTLITVVVVFSVVVISYILKDTITEFLSEGKSFSPTETKF